MKPALLHRLFPDDLHHIDGFHRAIREHLPRSGRILDLGCGANTVLAPYRDPHREVWGVDFAAHPSLRHADWFRLLGPDGRIPFPNDYFALIVCISVLEHVARPSDFITEVSRVLSPGGYFVAHSINGSHYVTWIRRAFGLLPHSFNQRLIETVYGRPVVDTFPAYYRLNRPRVIQETSQPKGFCPVQIRRYADPSYFSFWPPLMSLAVLADWSLEQLVPGWGRIYFTAILRKRTSTRIFEEEGGSTEARSREPRSWNIADANRNTVVPGTSDKSLQ